MHALVSDQLNTKLLYTYADLRLKIAELDGDAPAIRGVGQPSF
jgi:hypothetical protein